MYSGERGGREGLPAPEFSIVIVKQPLGGFSSNLAHVAVALGEISEYGVVTFQPKTCFSMGSACLNDILKISSPIHTKFG